MLRAAGCLSIILALAPTASAQAPSLVVVSPNLDALGYTGSFASALAGVADVDGVGDLLIGAPGELDSVGSGGRAYVYSGADLSILSELVNPNPMPLGIPWACNNFGWAAASMPDADGSGSGAAYAFYCTTEVEAAATVRLGSPPNPEAFGTD